MILKPKISSLTKADGPRFAILSSLSNILSNEYVGTEEHLRITGERGRLADSRDCGLVMIFVLGIRPLPLSGDWTVANIRRENADVVAKMLE